MLFKKSLVILLAILSFSNGNAQKFELGKVSKSELEQKIHPTDTSAVAAILYNKARTFFEYSEKNGFSIVNEIEFRIKIYKKEGLKWADYQVPFYVGYKNYNDDLVTFSNCVTYNLENGAIVKTKLNSEGNFKKIINKYWNEASITMPNVKVGSIIEFKYVLKSENIVEFPAYNFQYKIPVNYSEYNTKIPGFFIYKAVIYGSLSVNSEAKVESGSLDVNKSDFSRSDNLNFEQVNSMYKTYNIPALKEEPFVDNIQNYRSSIQHELKKSQFNDERAKDYSMTWDGVAEIIFKDKNFGEELNERLYLENDIKKVLKNVTSVPEKADAIFKFVQNKMNWNNQNGYYVDKGVKQAYVDGTGNTAEINFILIAMFNYAGIKANPVLVSTLEHGVPIYPNRTVFNYVIACAEIDGNQVLFDATNKNTTSNILPLNTLNKVGRLIQQDGTSEEINLVPKTPSREAINMMVSIDSNGKIVGKVKDQKTDYEAYRFREKYKGINKDNYLEKLENDLNGARISDYTIENIADLAKPISENFTFESNNDCEIIDGKMYINPLLFFTQTKNPFVQEKREYPIYFGYPKQSKYNINIQIPDGYIVESLPKPIKISTGENVGLFTFNISTSENRIQIQIAKDLNAAAVSSNFYSVLKAFYQQMIDKQNEKIILTKIL